MIVTITDLLLDVLPLKACQQQHMIAVQLNDLQSIQPFDCTITIASS